MQELLPNIYAWSWFSDEKGYDFNGYYLISEQEIILIDPPPMSPKDAGQLKQLGVPTAVIITNRDHVREAPGFAKAFSCPLWLHELDACLVDIPVENSFKSGDALPGGLVAHHVPNNKSPGECALFLDDGNGVLFLGDALIGSPAGKLNLMPPEKYADAGRAKEGLRVLLGLSFDALLLGDGQSFTTGGRKALEAFLDEDSLGDGTSCGI